MSLLPVAEAQARLLALATPVDAETVPLAIAAGRWAAADIIARRTQPAADLSAMDGYAIRFADLPGPFHQIGESAAGSPFPGAIGAGDTVRIFTGAALPEGADAVLIQEEARADGRTIHLAGESPLRAGGNVRRCGLDFREGDVLIVKGERLTPARIALAAIGGHATCPVNRPIRIAIAATGDELAPAGTLDLARLPESNGVMLVALLGGAGIELIDLGILPDRLDAMRDAFAGARADLIVTTGGASVGDHDLVRPALEAAGGTIDFWRIALRPGKPMLAGRLGEALFLGLPGNPVSAFVTAILFVRPLIAALAGANDPLPRTHLARLADALPANGPRTDYLRGWQSERGVSAASIQDSSMLLMLARADCLIVRVPHAPPAHPGDIVEIVPLA